MPETPEGSNAAMAAEISLAVSLDRIIDRLDQATDCYTAGRVLALGFQAWLSAERAYITTERRDAVLAAIARARAAVADTIPRESLAVIEDGLDALAEDVAAASGATMFGTVDHAALCASRIMLGQAEAAIVGLLISALFDAPEDRPRALVHAAEWQARGAKLAAEIAERRQPCGHAV